MNWLVSIIIPVYNRASLIGETLNSVISQTHSSWECIVVDDGSNDGTVNVVKKFSENDSRIKLYARPVIKPKGASSCRNYGIEMARGDFIQFLDSDDLLHNNKLFAQIKLADKYGDMALYTSKWGGFVDPTDLKTRFKYKVNSYKNYRRGMSLLDTFGLYNEFFPPHVYLIPRQLLDESGHWDETISNNDDAEFFTRIILNASRIIFVPDAIVHYRYHSKNNLSSLDSEKKIESAIASWNLIEEHIKENNNKNLLRYVKRAKANLFDHLKTQEPRILLKYEEFFSGRNDYDSKYYRYLKKLKQLF